MKAVKIISYLVLFCISTLIISCSGGSSGGSGGSNVPDTGGISLNASAVTLVDGYTYRFAPTVKPEGAVVSWTSTNDNAVLVSANGLMAALNTGSAVIRAKITVDGTDYTAECACTVVGAASTPFTTTSDGSEITITKYNGTDVEVIIPESIDGLPVTALGNTVFYNTEDSDLESITIPSGISSISSSSFWRCSRLLAINVVSENTIYSDIDGVLFNKGYTELCKYPAGRTGEYLIPAGALKIANEAFRDCTGLENVIIPSGLTNIGSGAFSGCSSLTEIILPSSVTVIGSGAFYNCSGLETVSLNEGLTNMFGAFNGCSGLTSVTIPSTVTNLDSNFQLCNNLREINVEPGNNYFSDIDGVLYNASATILLLYPPAKGDTFTIPSGVTSIATNAFSGCTDIDSIILPSGLTEIGYGAFSGCTDLDSMTLPSGLTQIGYGAFVNCTDLDVINIPEGVTVIDERTFENCVDLDSIRISSSVVTLNPMAFYRCSNLQSIIIDSANITYKDIDGIVYSKDGTTICLYPAGRKGQYSIPEGVTTIGRNAFAFTRVWDVIVPSSVTFIEYGAFLSNEGLLVRVENNTPPILESESVFLPNITIRVPSAAVATYKAAEYWSYHAARIFGY